MLIIWVLRVGRSSSWDLATKWFWKVNSEDVSSFMEETRDFCRTTLMYHPWEPPTKKLGSPSPPTHRHGKKKQQRKRPESLVQQLPTRPPGNCFKKTEGFFWNGDIFYNWTVVESLQIPWDNLGIYYHHGNFSRIFCTKNTLFLLVIFGWGAGSIQLRLRKRSGTFWHLILVGGFVDVKPLHNNNNNNNNNTSNNNSNNNNNTSNNNNNNSNSNSSSNRSSHVYPV